MDLSMRTTSNSNRSSQGARATSSAVALSEKPSSVPDLKNDDIAENDESSASSSIHDKEEVVLESYDEKPTRKQDAASPIGTEEEARVEMVDHAPPPEDSKLVTWDGPNDPQNPKNFGKVRKWAIVCTTAMMTFFVSLSSSIFSSAVGATAEEFDVSKEVMLLGVALFVVGFAFGPLVYGPISEVYGRSRPLFFGVAAFCVFQIPLGVATNLTTVLLARFFAGLFGAAPLAILGGLYVDFLDPIDMGIAISFFSGSVFVGPAMGPIVGSFITESHLGWRWTAWITLILSVPFTVLCYFVTPETFEPVLLQWKAERLRRETKDMALYAKSEEQKIDIHNLITKYLTKPMRMIVKEPILIVLTFYVAFCYGILYLTLASFPYSFQIVRGWSPGIASLPFIAIAGGVMLAAVIIGIFTTTWFQRRLLASGKKVYPELRVPTMMLGAIVLPAGLFWFAWTSDPSIPWPAQVFSGVLVGCGIILIFMSSILYLVDVYLVNTNSAFAINTFARAMFGAGFPMFAGHMYRGLGVAWATSVLAFVALALVPFPFIFWYYGEKIRSWSKFAFNLG